MTIAFVGVAQCCQGQRYFDCHCRHCQFLGKKNEMGPYHIPPKVIAANYVFQVYLLHLHLLLLNSTTMSLQLEFRRRRTNRSFPSTN